MNAIRGPVRNEVNPIDLLVVQATPFCNLDCDYCYLPGRDDSQRMAADTIHLIGRHILAEGWCSEDCTLVWHAGEPTVLPALWYTEAAAILKTYIPDGTRLTHSIQTNGTLLDESWLAWLRRPDVRIGISLDGPQILHDRHRRHRNGRGSFAETMRGIALLREADVPFHVIAVLTRESMGETDRLLHFFKQEGIERVAFNVEEIEGVNVASSLDVATARTEYVAFLRRWIDLSADDPDMLWVREIERATQSILRSPDTVVPNHQTEPFRILSVGVDGGLSAFSPELLGNRDTKYGRFVFANLADGGPESILANPLFQKLYAEITEGVRACAETCEFFRWCGGGAPANKLFELGSFAKTETMYCRLAEQAPILAVLETLERKPNV